MDQKPDYIRPGNWIEEGRGLTVEEAARYCGVSISYLNKLRCFGGGPVFEKAGRRVSYGKSDLDTWRNARRFNSTSEYPAQSAA